MVCQVFPHSLAACKCVWYCFWFSFSFFLYRNFISSFMRMSWAFFAVVCEAGDVDVLVTFTLAYLGVIFLFMHC